MQARILALGFFLFSFPLWADTFYVTEGAGVGVPKEEVQTLNELVRTAVGSIDGHQPSNDPNQANYSLKPKLLKLGNSYTVTLEKSKKDKVVFSSSLKADRIEDLDTVTQRLVRAVIDEKNPVSDVRITEVTSNDKTLGSTRRDAVKRWMLGFGPAGTANMNQSSNLVLLSVGYEWEIPSSDASIKILWEGVSGFSYLAFNGSYFLNNKDTSPFIHALVGYGGAKTESSGSKASENVNGFALGGGAGFRFFRTSSINMEVAATAATIAAQSSLGAPALLGARIGLYF